MENRKINIDRPAVASEEINKRRDFEKLKSIHQVLKDIPFYKNPWLLGTAIVTVISILVLSIILKLKSRNSDVIESQSTVVVIDSTKAPLISTAINPPITGLNIPYEEFKMNVQKGGKFTYKRTGTTFEIHPNTIVNGKGNIVQGEVILKYREFHDPIEIYVGGIPMVYDSAGQRYHFETAGMVDISAWQNGNRLQMKKGNKMEIRMQSYVDGDRFNLYSLDTITGKWTFLGKDKIVRPKKNSINEINLLPIMSERSLALESEILSQEKAIKTIRNEIYKIEKEKPVEPKKVNPKRSRFKINVDSTEFPDMALFRNVQFEVTPENSHFDNSVYKITWEDVELNQIEKSIKYSVTFKKGDSQVTYVVYPAYEGKDYERALDGYNSLFKEYQNKLTIRKEEEKQIEKELEENRKLFDEYVKNEKEKNYRRISEYNNYDQVTRVLTIDGFGVFNCDVPNKFPKGATISAKFLTEEGKKFWINNPCLIERNRKALFYIFGNKIWDEEKFTYNPKSQNMILGTTNKGEAAIFTFQDFDNMPKKASKHNFTMKIPEQKFENVEELKKYIGY